MILFTLILIALHCIFLYKAIKHFRQAYKDNIEPIVLEIGNVICASFANLTVGDMLINKGKIQGIRTQF